MDIHVLNLAVTVNGTSPRSSGCRGALSKLGGGARLSLDLSSLSVQGWCSFSNTSRCSPQFKSCHLYFVLRVGAGFTSVFLTAAPCLSPWSVLRRFLGLTGDFLCARLDFYTSSNLLLPPTSLCGLVRSSQHFVSNLELFR